MAIVYMSEQLLQQHVFTPGQGSVSGYGHVHVIIIGIVTGLDKQVCFIDHERDCFFFPTTCQMRETNYVHTYTVSLTNIRAN